MKLLLFSDLHADTIAAQQLLQQAQSVDVLVGAGDFATVWVPWAGHLQGVLLRFDAWHRMINDVGVHLVCTRAENNASNAAHRRHPPGVPLRFDACH